ncbi:MAG: Lpp/OprI family alanine-zipper lipoprotein [Methyloprofundus sp.]|nr:Lpp/OprI family alanine-zipper lipoprotein [Methyloprofundus sp.]
MIKLLKVSAIVLGSSLMVACASSGDLDKLQADIDKVQQQVNQASEAAANAETSANAAAASATSATAEATRAANAAAETNAKLDRLLTKTMMK